MATVGAISLPDALASGRSTSHHYVGHDRRAGPPADVDAGLGALGTVSTLLVLLWLGALTLFVVEATLPAGIDNAGLTSLLEAAAAALGSVVVVVSFVRWRLIGEARILWLGVAAFFLGPVAAGAGGLIPEIVSGPAPRFVSEVLVPTAELVGIAALAAAALVSEVDSRLRPVRAVAGAAIFAVAIAALLSIVPAAAAVVAAPTGQAATGIAWCAVALLHARAARSVRRRHYVAIVVAASGLAFAATTRALAAEAVGPFDAIPYVFVVIALAVLFGQGIRDLEVAFCVQREQLLDRQVVAEAEQARRDVEHTHEGRRRHDARNALMAIQGAAYVLDHHRDRIDADRREQLANAVTGEVNHLRELIETSRDPAPFRVTEMVNDLAVDEPTPSQIVLDVADDLVAVGGVLETTEVIRRLIRNAHHRAPGNPITVRSERDGDWVVVYVEDRGAGFERRQRDAVFDPASREGGEAGLGLFVCRRLMLDQGGDLWVEQRSGGGASFALCLPAEASEPTSEFPSEGAPDEHRRDAEEIVSR